MKLQTSTSNSVETKFFFGFSILFIFTLKKSLLALPPSFLARHQIKFYNITLSFKDCLGGDMMGNVVSISGFEVPVANGIMFSLRIGGFLKDDSNEFIYSWF